jgi:hypothetical protein
MGDLMVNHPPTSHAGAGGGFGRMRFLRGPFAALLTRMAALSCLPITIGNSNYPGNPTKHIRRGFVSRFALILGVHGAEPTTARRRL